MAGFPPVNWLECAGELNLNERYSIASETLLEDTTILNNDSKIVLLNAKQVMFSLFGMLYQLINEDVTKTELVASPAAVLSNEFVYGKFIMNYKEDDLDERLEKLIESLTLLVTEAYQIQEAKGEVTSVSNLFKTDKRYQEAIIGYIISRLGTSTGKEIIENAKMFSRK